MTLSEMMDQARDELGKLSEQKDELEKLWKVEKHNWGVEKKVGAIVKCELAWWLLFLFLQWAFQ